MTLLQFDGRWESIHGTSDNLSSVVDPNTLVDNHLHSAHSIYGDTPMPGLSLDGADCPDGRQPRAGKIALALFCSFRWLATSAEDQ